MNSTESIFITASAKRNSITTLVIGTVALCLSLLALALVPDWLFLGTVFLTSASIVTILIGYFKMREPAHSLEIRPDAIIYQHRRGQWALDWDNIQRVDMPKVRRGLDMVPLETVGFRLKHYDNFIQTISPRLATHLLMEQRPLLMQNLEDCPTGTCYGNDFMEDTRFKLESGKQLTGVQAMLASRMHQLRERLGYDVFVSSNELDRTPSEFVSLLKDCDQARRQRANP